MFFFDESGLETAGGYEKHHHSVMEFYFLTEGSCSFIIENRLYEVEAGDLVYIPKGVAHETTYSSVHSRMLINCNEDFLQNAPLPEFSVFRNKNVSPEIERVFLEIKAEYSLNDRFSEALICGFMAKLLALTARSENLHQNKTNVSKYIESALEYIQNNFCGEITLTELAERFGVTKEHLSRVFKKETGLNFSEYLTRLRLSKAEELLCYSNETVSQIAFAIGFNDSNYFSDKFKKIYGVSPLKFRKINRGVEK